MNGNFERPEQETRQRIWDACHGNVLCYIVSVLLVGIGVAGLGLLVDHIRLTHPQLVHFFGKPLVLPFSVFAAMGIAWVILSLFGVWKK
jgi:hypothetical protein